MGRRFVEFDWTAHPLGPPQSWPTEMRSMIAMVLTSSFPTVLWLDTDELFLIYNDAYIPILSDRQPAALGQRGQYAWWDVWEPVRPMLTSVIETGEATWSRDLMLPILTAGRRRERYFTFTYSPLVGADGTTFGVFCPSFETTERVLSERANAASQQRGLKGDGHQHHRRCAAGRRRSVRRPARRRAVRRGVRR